MNYNKLTKILADRGLKITPQRVAVLEVLYEIRNHPSAEEVRQKLHSKYPSIAIGTIYNILDTFCENGIIKKVKTDSDFVRYDVDMENHHHIYGLNNNLIQNYHDEELDKLLKEYFAKKGIPNFQIKEFSLQIIGQYTNDQNQTKQK
ncbi:Fur family transcriptional regulator [Tenuifilum thalassicum]|uniref:Transcriptional repressor n=1 Tax=Tenuifilum thalassicum TaxID=2590900 RepID=A0A7D4CGG9_9BACT|nr:Fur family transcriptional regulator [Tenuifilum thalassicum]QKG79826.1 transcriptional repressor [Tenuifilum thalassicum]